MNIQGRFLHYIGIKEKNIWISKEYRLFLEQRIEENKIEFIT